MGDDSFDAQVGSFKYRLLFLSFEREEVKLPTPVDLFELPRSCKQVNGDWWCILERFLLF